MPEITLYPGCKVNLYLEITGRRPNGYHDLEILFYPLKTPSDELVVRQGRAGSGFVLDCSDPALNGEHNILYKTYHAFAGTAGLRPDLNVTLTKNVPMGGGLGGGSADAGVFLRYLNTQAGCRGLSQEKLVHLAAGLGADVPFFLDPKPSWGRGIGELLRETAVDLSDVTMVLVCPDVHVDTAWAYRAWDDLHEEKRGADIGKKSLTHHMGTDKELAFVTSCVLFNSFEEVVLKKFPELYELKLGLLGNGAAGCVLTGSGASMVAFFRDNRSLDRGREFLESAHVSYFARSGC